MSHHAFVYLPSQIWKPQLDAEVFGTLQQQVCFSFFASFSNRRSVTGCLQSQVHKLQRIKIGYTSVLTENSQLIRQRNCDFSSGKREKGCQLCNFYVHYLSYGLFCYE